MSDLPTWLTTMVRLRLGNTSDAEVAKLAGVSRAQVSRWRRKLNIPSFQTSRMASPRLRADTVPTWLTPDVMARLGTEPDADIARDAGVSRVTVGSRRRALGIEAWRDVERAAARKRFRTVDEMVVRPDEVAGMLDVTRSSVDGRRWEGQGADRPEIKRGPRSSRSALRRRIADRHPELITLLEKGEPIPKGAVPASTLWRWRKTMGWPAPRREPVPSEGRTSTEAAEALGRDRRSAMNALARMERHGWAARSDDKPARWRSLLVPDEDALPVEFGDD